MFLEHTSLNSTTHLSPTLRCLWVVSPQITILASLGRGQFLVRATIGGHSCVILYDTGASISFARSDLPLLSGALPAQSEEYKHLATGGLKIRLGDDSDCTTDACVRLQFHIKGHAHDWDFHVMRLPQGIDMIIGMDFMEENDVTLLCGQKKVMYGSTVLNALSLKLNDLYGQVDQIQGPAEEAKAETPSSASNTSEKSFDPDPQPTPVQNFFSMHGPTDDTEFDCDLCYDGAQFDLLAAQHAAVDDPIAFFQFYCKTRASDESLSDEQRHQLLDEYEQSRRDYQPTSSKSKTAPKTRAEMLPNLVAAGYTPYKDNPVIQAYKDKNLADEIKQKEQSDDDNDDEVDGKGSFLCVLRRNCEATLSAMHVAQEISGCFPMSTSDQESRADKVSDALRKKLLEKQQARYEEFSRAWKDRQTVEPTEENIKKWLEEYYPKDENGVSIAGQIDVTIPGHEAWCDSLKKGEVCSLAGKAFDDRGPFNPPPWAESLRLFLDATKGVAKCGHRIRCPVHLREELQKFHEKLYEKGFIEPATDCDSYASVLIIRKPDDAQGRPRGYRFVVDLRERNKTVVNIANQLPEAAMIFELLYKAKCINVFDVRDGYWNCPLFYDESDPDCAQNNSRRLTAFQSECGEWQWKCLPQGLTSAGGYFSAWLTRTFRKYHVVKNQTKYVPKDAEEQKLTSVQNILAVAKVIASLPDRAKSPEPAKLSALVHDCKTADDLYAADRAFFTSSDDKSNIRARLKAANKRVSSQLKQMANPSTEKAAPASAVAPESDSPSVSHTFLTFVNNAIEIEVKEIACIENAVPLASIEDCAQFRRPDNDNKPILLHDCVNGSNLYADSQSFAMMNSCIAVTGSAKTWSAEILASATQDIVSDGQCSDLMRGGLSTADLQSADRDSLRPGDLGVWTGNAFLSLYLDDGITSSLVGVEEAKQHALVVCRICAIERIPLNQKVNLLCKYVRFLGMINGNGLVIPCPEKIKHIVFLTRPIDIKSLQSFLGSVNWFRRHITSHAEIQKPLNALTRKDTEWNWTEDCERAWLSLKRSLMTFPVLRIFNPALPAVLYTDSSSFHVGGALTQRLPSGELVAIAYYSRSLRGPELSYPIQHKEALAIVACCMAFCHYLLAAHFTVRTCSDHKSLSTCFHGMSKVACDRVTRWVQKLCMFNMTVEYMPGVNMDLPDLLSRSIKAPEEAWKLADVIDAVDFEYAPLLSMIPGYHQNMQVHYGDKASDSRSECNTEMNFSAKAIEYDESLDDPEKAWFPHERAMMMPLTVMPQTTSVFCETDYFTCPDYDRIYQSVLIRDGLKTEADVKRIAEEARTIVKERYENLQLVEQKQVVRKRKSKDGDVCNQHMISGGLLYRQDLRRGPLLCVPNVYDDSGVNHRKKIFDECHAVDYRGHRGINGTREAMRTRFYWPQMLTTDINNMVKACVTCNNSKIQRKVPQGLSTPLEQPGNICQSYNIDFIGPLPRSSHGNHMIMIAVDRFSRRTFLYALSKHATSENVGDLFVNEICMREGRGLPRVIISDHDALFTANFWRTMFKRFGTKLNFTHGARSQHSNGLAERTVAIVEEILRTRVNYRQDDWEDLIPFILFILNMIEKKTLLGKCPMEVELGILPLTPMDIVSEITAAKADQKNKIEQSGGISAAQQRISDISAKREEIALWYDEVQAEQFKFSDARRRTAHELLKVGAKAYVKMPYSQMLNQSLRPSSKLAHQHFGPFKIVRMCGVNAFELDLGAAVTKKTIPVFHVKYLTPAPVGPYVSGSEALSTKPVTGQGTDTEWELCRIVDRRTRYKKHEYLVEYKGFPLTIDNEWRPEIELQETAPTMLKDFNELYDSRMSE